jgi:hypothetical protein
MQENGVPVKQKAESFPTASSSKNSPSTPRPIHERCVNWPSDFEGRADKQKKRTESGSERLDALGGSQLCWTLSNEG